MHDHSRPTADEFESHLDAARDFIDRHHSLTKGMAVICCWNEYGEGSVLEPTEGDGNSLLRSVRRAFSAQEPRAGGHELKAQK